MNTSDSYLDKSSKGTNIALSIQQFLSDLNRKLESMSKLLQKEREELISGSADEMNQATQNKNTYLQAISNDTFKYLNNIGINPNADLEQSLRKLGNVCEENNIPEWNETLVLIQQCRELSDENSIRIANRLKSTNSALNTLYSLTGISQNNTYDNNGHSSHSPISRQITSV